MSQLIHLRLVPNLQLDVDRASIMGHSMGGHGAITIGLKNAMRFRSISAFAPICNPCSKDCPWGIKAFTGLCHREQCDIIRLQSQMLII